MKEFMLIFLGADYESAKLSPDEVQAQMQKWFQWVDKLKSKSLEMMQKMSRLERQLQ